MCCLGLIRFNPLRIGELFPTKRKTRKPTPSACCFNPLRIGELFPTARSLKILGYSEVFVSIPFASGNSFQRKETSGYLYRIAALGFNPLRIGELFPTRIFP